MTLLILLLTLVVTLSGGEAEGESQKRWVPQPPAAPLRAAAPTKLRQADPAPHGHDNTTGHQTLPCYPLCKVTGHPQRQVSLQDEEYQTKENINWILEADTNMAANTIDLIKKREVISPTEKLSDKELQIEDESLNEIATTSNKDSVDDVFNKGDLIIPYDSLGWFSKAVEVAMDGSLYIGLVLGVMFISASVLSGAIDLFGDTCLICAFISYANTVLNLCLLFHTQVSSAFVRVTQ